MSDLIDRQAAIDAVFGRSHDIIKQRLKNLPSAQPEILACGEGELNVPDTNVGGMISRQAAIEAIRAMQTYKLFAGDDLILVDQAGAQTELMMLPSAQQDCTECEEYDKTTHSCPKYCDVIRQTVEEAKQERTGRWIYGEDKYGIDGYHCDKCGFFVPWDYAHKFINYIEDYNFCPNCGADMGEGEG